nr:unnamed protein product [Callosobruchus analis]
MYGVASAPAIWQKTIENILQGTEGVAIFFDDVRITAPIDNLHLQRLRQVLKRFHEYNVRVNFDKYKFLADEIEYCGYVMTKAKIQKSANKMDVISKIQRPENQDDLRVFLELVNYYGRFFKNKSFVTYPLNKLLHKNVTWHWDAACEAAFNFIKGVMNSDAILTHFDPKHPLILATDSSSVGVGAVLSHVFPDGTEKPIQFASQTLSETQRKYSQINKEAYATIALVHILIPHKNLPVFSVARMQHYAIFLQSFNYEIKYKITKAHSNADAMSRHISKHIHPVNFIEEPDILNVYQINNLPISVKDLSVETSKDVTVSKLLEGLQKGTDML